MSSPAYFVTLFDIATTTATTANELCDTSGWSAMSSWTFDSTDCSLENANSNVDTVMWFGFGNGSTPNSNYVHDTFNLTVTLSLHSGLSAGVLFRTEWISSPVSDSRSYYLLIRPSNAYSKTELLIVQDGDGGSFVANIGSSVLIEYNTSYTLSVHAQGNVYDIYLDDILIFDGIIRNEISNGTIGVRCKAATCTVHSIQYDSPTTDPTASPTLDYTIDPTEDSTTNPTMEPTTDLTANPTTDLTANPTSHPIPNDTSNDTSTPPRYDPSPGPTMVPTTYLTPPPSVGSTDNSTTDPTVEPTTDPTLNPTVDPTDFLPSESPTSSPASDEPTIVPVLPPIEAQALESDEHGIYLIIIIIGSAFLFLILLALAIVCYSQRKLAKEVNNAGE